MLGMSQEMKASILRQRCLLFFPSRNKVSFALFFCFFVFYYYFIGKAIEGVLVAAVT